MNQCHKRRSTLILPGDGFEERVQDDHGALEPIEIKLLARDTANESAADPQRRERWENYFKTLFKN